VEKILWEKGDDVYVKWLGMDKSYNSWIHKNNTAPQKKKSESGAGQADYGGWGGPGLVWFVWSDPISIFFLFLWNCVIIFIF